MFCRKRESFFCLLTADETFPHTSSVQGLLQTAQNKASKSGSKFKNVIDAFDSYFFARSSNKREKPFHSVLQYFMTREHAKNFTGRQQIALEVLGCSASKMFRTSITNENFTTLK